MEKGKERKRLHAEAQRRGVFVRKIFILIRYILTRIMKLII